MKKLLLLLLLLLFNGNANAVLQCYNDQGQNLTWTMGEVVPYLDTEPGVYVNCTADGNELLFIQHNFTGIRSSRFTSVEWTGEDATFVYQNLWIETNDPAPSAAPSSPVANHGK